MHNNFRQSLRLAASAARAGSHRGETHFRKLAARELRNIASGICDVRNRETSAIVYTGNRTECIARCRINPALYIA